MNKLSNACWLGLLLLLVLASLVNVASAQTTSKPSIARTIYQGETHTGKCCSSWGDPIRVYEPERMQPIVVVWSTDYRATAPALVGLQLNNGPCTFFGPAYIPTFAPDDETYQATTFQFVIMPGDYKLLKGVNEISVCGGGIFADTDSVTFGFSTLVGHLER
jgi:hypothetical protein